MEEMISAPCSFRAAFPSEHPLKNESMKQCIRREKANPRSTKVPSSYGFVLRQSPRPRHLPEGNKISERYFFGFVEKPTPLRASLHNKAEIQHFSGASVRLGSPQELRRPGRWAQKIRVGHWSTEVLVIQVVVVGWFWGVGTCSVGGGRPTGRQLRESTRWAEAEARPTMRP